MKHKYISSPEPIGLHPKLRIWSAWVGEPGFTAIDADVVREREGLVLKPARLYLAFRHGASVVHSDETDWTPELDGWLITIARAKGSSVAFDKTRFAQWLRNNLQPAIRRFGDGFFNVVFMEIVRRDFGDQAEVAQVLPKIYVGSNVHPDRRGECVDLVEQAFNFTGKPIADLYGDSADAAEVLAGAVAQYLDERFSVTNRLVMGFL